MKYSRYLAMELMQSSVLSEEMNYIKTRKWTFSIPKPLDVFETLLFFFLFQKQNKFSSSKFLQFFAGIQKISDLKQGKEKFLTCLDDAFGKLNQISLLNDSQKTIGPLFQEYHREKNDWKYILSDKAQKLSRYLRNDLSGEIFRIDTEQGGIAIAYLGAYIYLCGVSGQEEIDLSYCEKQKVVQAFSPGYSLINRRSAILKLVRKFSEQGIFQYGSRLENLNDNTLHVKIRGKGRGLHFEQKKKLLLEGKSLRTRYDGELHTHKRQERLETLLAGANLTMDDFQYHGKMLMLPYYLAYKTNYLKSPISFQWPGSHIPRPELKNIVYGQNSPCSVLEIENIRNLYVTSFLKKGWKTDSFYNISGLPWIKGKENLLIELILDAIWKYENEPEQSYKALMERYHKYFRQGLSRDRAKQLIDDLFQKYYKIGHFYNTKKNLSGSNFFTDTWLFFLEWRDQCFINNIPALAGDKALIVPTGKELSALNIIRSVSSRPWKNRHIKIKLTATSREDYYRIGGRHQEWMLTEKSWKSPVDAN